MSAEPGSKLFVFFVVSISNEDMFGQIMHTFVFQAEYFLILDYIPQAFLCLVIGHVYIIYVEEYAFVVRIRWIFYQCFLLYKLDYFSRSC